MSDVNAELLAAAKRASEILTGMGRCLATRLDLDETAALHALDAAIARAEAAQGVEPSGGEESVGVTRTCACEPMCGFVCAQCSEVRT